MYQQRKVESTDLRARTCFKKTCNWGCDSGFTVTSNRGRKILSRMFWNDVTIPISLYILYRRGSCKTEHYGLNTYNIHILQENVSSIIQTSKSIIYLPLLKLKSILWVLIFPLDFVASFMYFLSYDNYALYRESDMKMH